jgi:hypothetical protein
VDSGSTLELAGLNTFPGYINVLGGSTLIAGSDTAFGTGQVSLVAGGAAVDSVTLDLGGYAVASDAAMNGGVGRTTSATIVGGENFAGSLFMGQVGDSVTVTIPAGEALNGTANILVAGPELVIEGQHTGTIVNAVGTVIVDDSTAADPPVNVYAGNCGSTYAVRAA